MGTKSVGLAAGRPQIERATMRSMGRQTHGDHIAESQCGHVAARACRVAYTQRFLLSLLQRFRNDGKI